MRMDFDKVSFRTTPEEREYLDELAHRYGATSITEFVHRFLADCRRTNVGNVYNKHSDRTYGDNHRRIEHNDSDQSYRHRPGDSVNTAMMQFTIYQQQQEIRHLRQLNKQQEGIINQQRQQLDNLEQQLYSSYSVPPFWMMPMNRHTEYDPMAIVMTETEKAARMRKAMSDLAGW